MEYKFINMKEIEGASKISVSSAFKNSTDLDLFEQEAIQFIIDYKWDTYSKSFFQKKFLAYSLYMFVFYLDCEIMHNQTKQDGKRIKSAWFWVRKSVCFLIQLGFLIYEFIQARTEGHDYWLDLWNYFEIIEPALFTAGAILDI